MMYKFYLTQHFGWSIAIRISWSDEKNSSFIKPSEAAWKSITAYVAKLKRANKTPSFLGDLHEIPMHTGIGNRNFHDVNSGHNLSKYTCLKILSLFLWIFFTYFQYIASYSVPFASCLMYNGSRHPRLSPNKIRSGLDCFPGQGMLLKV